MNSDDEEALIDREFTEHRDGGHSDSDGYSTCLASTQNGDHGEDDDEDSMSSDKDDSEEDERSTSSSSDDDDVPLHSQLLGQLSIMRRRGIRTPQEHQSNEDGDHSLDDSKHKPKRDFVLPRERTLCRLANAFLCTSILLWLLVVIASSGPPSEQGARPLNPPDERTFLQKLYERFFSRRHAKLTVGQIAQLRKQRTNEARLALGSAAEGGGFFSFLGYKKKKLNANVEAIPPGCDYLDWQKTSFPNCNELHEIDLVDALRVPKRRSKKSQRMERDAEEKNNVGYVDSGLWRTVWKVDPRGEKKDQVPAVLKMMKGEHDVDQRNMDRHRRDALVMERLTSSPHIVSMYAYCGNSALTEYLSVSLEAVIYQNETVETFPTRQTPEGRLQLALGVAKGIQAFHEMEGGPAIHADVVTKQFLLGEDGNMKLNDFNRCRFIAHRNDTGENCDVRIPSAPGNSRSPEEYAFNALTEKVDIYSGGNVLYEILTGEEPWLKLKILDAQERISKGEKPPIADQYLKPKTSDAGLAALIDLTYEFDPVSRISASDLVRELEILIRDFGA